MTMEQWLEKAWKCGCPLLAIETPEPIGDGIRMQRWALGNLETVTWDRVSGIPGVGVTDNPERFIAWAQGLPAETAIVAQWQAPFWSSPTVCQGVLNLRDQYKMDGRMLILVGNGVVVPSELRANFLQYDVALPDSGQLEAIIRQVARNKAQSRGLAKEAYQGQDMSSIVAACQGMSSFETEQHCAMAWNGGEMPDVATIWQSKVQLINNTQGLQCWQGSESLADLRGLDGFARDMQAIADGRLPARLVVWIDESEDVFAGVQGDTSGISQDYLGLLSKHIQDTHAQSILLTGHPGTGKSHCAKAAGSFFGCLVLALDLGACKGSLVGQSEARLRHALATERAIVGGEQGSTLWIWTSNNPSAIPDKMRARNQAEYFFDLSAEQEALAIWSLHRGKYDIAQDEAFPSNSDGWTGREIERCCRLAWQYRCSLSEAGRRIVPIKLSQAEAISERRKAASGRFLSPVTGEVFVCDDVVQQQGKRKMRA